MPIAALSEDVGSGVDESGRQISKDHGNLWMPDIVAPEKRSALMSRIRSTDTKPELFVRRALHAMGYRFRTHVRGLPGCPDLVFTRRRSVIFVHGCFWHRHGCRKTYVPKSRKEFWQEKFVGNVSRDRRNQRLLEEAGWRVLVVWECEIESDDSALERAARFLGPLRMNATFDARPRIVMGRS